MLCDGIETKCTALEWYGRESQGSRLDWHCMEKIRKENE